MEYAKGYVYELMDKGGPTNVAEPYFKEAVDEMMRAGHFVRRQMLFCPMIHRTFHILRNCSGENLMMSAS